MHIRDKIHRRKDYIHIDEETKPFYKKTIPCYLVDTDVIHKEAVVFDAHYACLENMFMNSHSTYSDGKVLYIPKDYTAVN
jgi:hypothetical protein